MSKQAILKVLSKFTFELDIENYDIIQIINDDDVGFAYSCPEYASIFKRADQRACVDEFNLEAHHIVDGEDFCIAGDEAFFIGESGIVRLSDMMEVDEDFLDSLGGGKIFFTFDIEAIAESYDCE